MLNLEQVYKPAELAEALVLLEQPNTVALAGGTALIAGASRSVRAVVDLSQLGLSYIRSTEGAIAIGATTKLADLAESPVLRALANGVVAQAAHRTASSVLRNQATVAGTLITEPDGILAVVLLALDAWVTIVRKQTLTVAFADFLPASANLLKNALITEITVPMSHPRASLQTVARTPSDKPIVVACAAVQAEEAGRVALDVRLALGGVGTTALRANAVEQALEGKTLDSGSIEKAAEKAPEGLAPRGDFRGSTEYRKAMAVVMARRALEELLPK